MSDGQQHFGVSDVEYNIITTMSNLLQGEDVLDRYASDADAAGNSDVARIFRDLQEQNNRIAGQLREALKAELGSGS
jgi:hypothetical protein